MDEYSIEEIKAAYVGAFMPGRDMNEAAAMFDASLTAHDRVVAANAWDEGFTAGEWIDTNKTNPYRITEENN